MMQLPVELPVALWSTPNPEYVQVTVLPQGKGCFKPELVNGFRH